MVADRDEDDCENRRKHQSVTALKAELRVDGKHVMDAVQRKVHVAYHGVVKEIVFGVKQEPVEDVLEQGETEHAQQQYGEAGDQRNLAPLHLVKHPK